MAALRTELAASQAQGAEHERTARFWFDKSKNGTPEKPAAATEDADEDVLDLITSKGAKGLAALLKKQGFISAAEVDEKVNEKAAQITSEAKLLETFPDLADSNSDFFKATVNFYGQLKKEGVPERTAMKLAAQQAKLAGIESGSIKTATQKTADDAATRASDRAARAAAGAGDHGRREAAEEADEELTAEQRHIAIRLLGGAGVTDEQAIEKYKARAKKGVAMKSK